MRNFIRVGWPLIFACAVSMSATAVIAAKSEGQPGSKAGSSQKAASQNSPSISGQQVAQTTAPQSQNRAASASQLSPELQNALSTSHEGLEVKPCARGGEMVDLQGRFQCLMKATTTDGGGNGSPCVSGSQPKKATCKHKPDARPASEGRKQ